MSAAKRAPGPWSCIVEGNDAFVMPAGGSPCVTLIKLRGAGTSYSESLANARLIAAAPDLLAAAKQALACMRGLQQHVGAAACDPEAAALAAAIAKATGAAS